MTATLVPTLDQPVAPLRRARAGSHFAAAWPVYALFAGYPLWWALGLQAFIWPLAAVPMALALLRRRSVSVPRGAGFLLLFLVWMLLSATQLESARQLVAFGYRASLYFSAAILLVFLVNLPARAVDVSRLAQAAGWMWVASIVGAYVGLLLPGAAFATPLELALPQAISQQPFVNSLVHNEWSSTTTLLGYTIARPKALFNYTNGWGANVALLTPLAVYSLHVVRKRWWRVMVLVLLAASVVPIIISINRGLWLSLVVAGAYMGLRAAGRGRIRLLLGVLLAAGATLALVALTPLSTIVSDRAEVANLDGRTHLYNAAFDAALNAPVLGYGAPLPSDNLDLTAGASVGTHGQLWTLLVSQGFVGLVLFVGFLVATLFYTRRVSRHALWAHTVLVVALFQLPFYNSLPVALHVVVLAAAFCWWDIRSRRQTAASARRGTSEGHRIS